MNPNIDADNTIEINKQIYLAAVMNYPISLKFLLEKHADCKAKDGKECLALLLAAAENKTEAVKFLLKHNLDVHVKGEVLYKTNLWSADSLSALADEFEQTALHIATTKGHEATVKLLLEHDANVHVKGEYLSGISLYRNVKMFLQEFMGRHHFIQQHRVVIKILSSYFLRTMQI
ncbi:hypothetical protein C0989_000999 [Termitomyces sp. Mn162]|nr:hypothetical protein C0989_000999 [Termitomyces sp. Mn162]